MLTVCTGWSPKGWIEYGERFAETFDQFWPREVRLIVCGEEPRALPVKGGREWEFRPLSAIEGLCDFIAEHAILPDACGRKKLPQHQWKERAIAAGYNWRYDAVKFCRQAYIPCFVMDSLCEDGDLLCWLDGDVVTHRPIKQSDIEALLPAAKSVAYLGRGPKHPEIGFQLYRCDPFAARVTAMFRRIYDSGEVFDLREWHSAYVWQEALARAIKEAGVNFGHDLTPGGSGHVWHQSPLRQWTDHLKGDRKKSGRSAERRL